MGVSLHGLTTRLVGVFDKAQVEGASAVLIALELGNGSFRSVGGIKLDDASSA